MQSKEDKTMNNTNTNEFQKAKTIADNLLNQFDSDMDLWLVISFMQGLIEHGKSK